MQKITVGLAKTPEGNRLIMEVLERQARREIELENLAMQYIGERGELDHRWIQYKNAWVEAHPLFDDLNARLADF